MVVEKVAVYGDTDPNATDIKTVPFSLKSTLPVGVPESPGVTVAMNVTFSPRTVGDLDVDKFVELKIRTC